MKHLSHLKIVGALLLLLSVYYFTVGHGRRVLKESAKTGVNENVRHLNRTHFLDVRAETFVPALDNAFARCSQTNVYPQADSLLYELHAFVHCFSEGTFDSYIEFKSSGIPCEFNFGGKVKHLILSATESGTNFAEAPLPRARQIWELVCQPGSNGVGTRITDVAVDRLSLVAHKGGDPHQAVLTICRRNSGAGMVGEPLNSLVACKEAVDVLAHSRDDLWWAVLGIPSRMDHNITAHYFHVCFILSDTLNRWVPLTLIDDNANRTRMMF